jgi:GntR family transcriptional regulator
VVTEKMTRWEEISGDLAEAIASNRFPVGSDLPSEAALSLQYGVSRFTVREALRRLADSGLIVRRHGSGSRVIADRPKQAYLFTLDSESDVLRYAAETTMQLSSKVGTVSRRLADDLDLYKRDEWIQLNGVRYSPTGERIGLVIVCLRAEHADVASTLEKPIRQAIYAEILGEIQRPLVSIEQRISATLLTATDARRLGATAGEPALRIIRRYNLEDGPVEVSMNVHPASRFEYALSIQPVGLPGQRVVRTSFD